MPRVLIVTPEFPPYTTGGLGTHLVALCAGLAGRGWNIDVVVPARGAVDGRWPDAALPFTAHGARVHVVAHGEATRAMHPSSRRAKVSYMEDLRACALEVAANEERGRVDVIHLHDWFLGPVAATVRERIGAPLVTTIHLLYKPLSAWCGYTMPADQAAVEAEACRGADRVIAVSRDMAALIRETYDVPAERVVAIHNGLDEASIELFAGAPAPVAPPTIVYAGRITRQKGVVPLVQAARLVLDAIPEARWQLAGAVSDPMLRRDTGTVLSEEIATDPRLGAAITLTGSVDRGRLAAMYRDAALAIVPSVYEPFGYAALEAMCAGVPVVATAVGGLPEIVEDGVTGLLVPRITTSAGERSPDVEALARAQIDLLRDPVRARRMGEAGRVRALASFPPGKMAEETEAVYRAVIA